MTHATAIRDGFKVPLIGIPEDASLEECDLCHDLFPFEKIKWTGCQMLCEKCNRPEMPSGESLKALWAKGAEAWKDVPNATKWVEDLRGNSTETK